MINIPKIKRPKKDIVEKMLNANNLVVPDNLSYVTSDGHKS